MPRPGAKNPWVGEPYVLTATSNTVKHASGFRIGEVKTAGTIWVQYKGSDVDVPLYFPAGGPYYEPGYFKQIWSDGTIVVEPTGTIVTYGG